MKKMVLGAVIGLLAYKIIKTYRVVARVIPWLGKIFLDSVVKIAMKNGVTDEEIEEFLRIGGKALGGDKK